MSEQAVAESTYFIPEESVTGPAGEVYQKQLAFEKAQRTYEWERGQAYERYEEAQQRALARGGFGPLGNPEDQAQVVVARKAMEMLRGIMEQAQADLGGIVSCVANDNLPKLQKKLASLSKRAVNLGLDPITLTPTDETVLLEYTYAEDRDRGYSAEFEHTYCILTGGTPKIEGFQFLATIEHTEAGNIVKKIPPLAAMMRGMVNTPSEEKAAEALEAIDVTAYRTTPPLCEHCNKIRSRKDTYLVYNTETGETKQVGRSCLRDYTGADNPEAIVKFLEMYFESMRGLRESRGEKPIIRTREFLAHVAVVIGTGYQSYYTKEWALTNYFDMREDKKDSKTGQPTYTVPGAAEYETADAMIDWALNKWEAQNDYALNVKTAIANPAVPEKAYGLVASVFVAKARWDGDAEKRHEREAETNKEAERSFVGEVKERINLIVKILSITAEDGYMGDTAYRVRMEDAQGNYLIWKASRRPWKAHESGPVIEGGEYMLRATIKKHHVSQQGRKSTIVTRGEFTTTISEPEREDLYGEDD